MPYRDPTESEMKDALWNRIWLAIKDWDVRTPENNGYTGATGNHVCEIYDAVRQQASSEKESQ